MRTEKVRPDGYITCLFKCSEDKGVHIITVNDYLAKRDSEWMGQIHEFRLKVGVI